MRAAAVEDEESSEANGRRKWDAIALDDTHLRQLAFCAREKRKLARVRAEDWCRRQMADGDLESPMAELQLWMRSPSSCRSCEVQRAKGKEAGRHRTLREWDRVRNNEQNKREQITKYEEGTLSGPGRRAVSNELLVRAAEVNRGAAVPTYLGNCLPTLGT